MQGADPISAMIEAPKLSLRAAYEFGAAHELGSEIKQIRGMPIEWDRYTSSLRRGYIVELFQERGLLDDFIKERWPGGGTTAGINQRARYLRIRREYEEFLQRNVGTDDEDEDEGAEEASEQRFAAEADLRDFLAKNLACIESGLRLYSSSERSGVEFYIDGGYIDILAVDSAGRFVVIELKVGRGRNRTVGQLLYYMGWVDKNLAQQPCRGMIIAREIPQDLILAARRVPGVSLHRYHLSVSVETVVPE